MDLERRKPRMDTLNFGSFPRSGNHFLYEALNNLLPNCKIDWLEHRIEPLDKMKNVLVTIRNPFECIPSWIVYTSNSHQNREERMLEWYCAYYEKCSKTDLIIVPFNQLIGTPVHAISEVCKKYSLDFPKHKDLILDLSTGLHSPTLDKSSFPDIVKKMELAPSVHRAMSLFEELCVPVG